MLIDFVQWTASLPSQVEFDAVWSSIISRLEGDACVTDWNEKEMASYIREHILTKTNGMWDAPWRCGVGTTRLGLTSYAVNAIESSHRTLKSLLDSGYQKRSMTTVVVEICEALQSRLKQGRYDALKNEVSQPWLELLQCHRKQHGTVGDDDEVWGAD